MSGRKNDLRAALWLLPFLLGCPEQEVPRSLDLRERHPEERPTRSASVIALIAKSEDFDGEAVGVIGTLRVDGEESALFLHEEDYFESNIFNAVRLTLSESEHEKLAPFDGRGVLLFATFFAEERHGWPNRGVLRDPSAIDPFPELLGEGRRVR